MFFYINKKNISKSMLVLIWGLAILIVGCFSRKRDESNILPTVPLVDNKAIWEELLSNTINRLKLLPTNEQWIASETEFVKNWHFEEIKLLADIELEDKEFQYLQSHKTLVSSVATSSIENLDYNFIINSNAVSTGSVNVHFWEDIFISNIISKEAYIKTLDNRKIPSNTLYTIFDLLNFKLSNLSKNNLNLSIDKNEIILGNYTKKISENKRRLLTLAQTLDLFTANPLIIVDNLGNQTKVNKFFDVKKIIGIDEICKKLEESPLIGLLPVYKDFLLYRGGVYKPLGSELIGYTSFIILNFDKEKGTVLGRLNWTTKWGENGYFRIKSEYIPAIAWTISLHESDISSIVEHPKNKNSNDPTIFDNLLSGNGGIADIIVLEKCPLVEFGPITKYVSSKSVEIIWINKHNNAEYEIELFDSKASYRYRPSIKNSTIYASATISYVNINDLKPSTDYNWRLLYKSQDGTVSQSSVYNLVQTSLLATSQPNLPVIFNISVSNITSQSAKISWQTDVDSYGRVVFQPQNATQTYIKHDWRLTRLHTVTLSGLIGGTTYYFTIQAWNNNLATTTSDPEIFQTNEITPPIISDVSAVEITPYEATIVWLTNEPTVGQVEYGLTAGYGWYTPFSSEYKKTHRMKIKDLKPNTTYFFRIRAKDLSGNETESTSFSFATLSDLDLRPNIILVASATSISTSSALIVWQTLKDSTSLVEYGTSQALGSQTSIITTYKTSHVMAITGLLPDTLYYYRVRSKDQQGFEAISELLTFKTLKNVLILPLVIENATATAISDTSATIVWTTNIPARSYVEYGTTPAYGFISRKTTELRYSHLIKITGLLPDKEYYYRIISEDEYGNIASQALLPFKTLDTIPPQIRNISVVTVTGSSASIIFSTSEPSFSKIEYGTNNYDFQILNPANVATTTHHYTITSLTPATTYKFRIIAWDKANNLSFSSDQYIKTVDTILPQIWNIRAEEVTNNSAKILWNTDKQCTSLVIYGPSSNNYTSTSTFDPTFKQNHSIKITFDPTISNQWFYRVISKDRLGNETISGENSFTVPLIITNLQVSNITDSSASVTWKTTRPATSMVEYGTNPNLNLQEPQFVDPLKLLSSHSIDLLNLQSNTIYYYRVKSKDLFGNTAVSPLQTFLTLPSTQPPVISNIVVYNITDFSAAVSWNTNSPTTGYVEVGLEPYKYIQKIVSVGGLKTSHSVNLTNLLSGRNYYFQIFVTDTNGRTSSSTIQTFTTTGIKRPLISNLRVFDINDRSVRLEWNTDDACYSEIRYGITNNLELRINSGNIATTSHSIIITNLQPDTTYFYKITCKNANTGLESSTSLASFTTLDITPPLIYDLQVINVGTTTATIMWKTDEPATRQLIYWFLGSTIYQTSSNTILNKVHQVTLSGLTPATIYYFKAISSDKYGNLGYSEIATFSTLDLLPPQVSNISIIANNGLVATITFDTDKPSLAWVDYGTTTAFGNTRPLSPTQYLTSHTIVLDNLQQGVTYWYRIKAVDKHGNTTITRNYAFTNLDLLPPVISSVRTTNITENSVTILWRTDERSKSIVDYGPTQLLGSTISRDVFTTDHSITISLLSSNTKYYYKIKAQDMYGNISEAGIFSFETLDKTPPDFVVLPSATAILEESAVVSFITNEPTIAKVEYGQNTIFSNYVESNSFISTHVVVLDNLKPLTTYYYRVKIRDKASIETTSEIYSFTTPAVLIIQNIRVTNLTATQATLLWDTTVPAYCEISHGRTLPLPFSNIPEDNVPGVGAPFTSSHTVNLNLVGPYVPGTYYYFMINATTSNGIRKNSGLRYFLTP